MANKARPQERDRRAKVEALRREQQAKERRKSLMFIGGSIVIGLALIAIVAFPAIQKSRNDPAKKPLASFGVEASAAGCSKPTTDKLVDGTHDETNSKKVKYQQIPPSTGPHWASPVQSPAEFYSSGDRPAMEALVHNLEHGYTIVWYDSTIKGDQLQALKDISARARTEKTTRGKFIVSAWDNAYGKFPSGKHVAMSHWGAKSGHRQLCAAVSGDAVAAFIKAYPSTDSPEPNAP